MAVLARRSLLLALALVLAGGFTAYADDENERDDDHEQALHALEQGQVRPLADILADIGDQLDGDVVSVEFERSGNRYIYEFKVVTADGSLREVFVDAASAEILNVGAD
jgi:uncharacterized membrane protein YkoI